jgi:hypothetical protein
MRRRPLGRNRQYQSPPPPVPGHNDACAACPDTLGVCTGGEAAGFFSTA